VFVCFSLWQYFPSFQSIPSLSFVFLFCDAGDNIDQKKEKLYIIRTVFNYMRIVPVCERERNYTKKKHIKKKKCHHRLVFPLLSLFTPGPETFFLFVCILLFFFISFFLSIISSLDIFLFVSLYTYILLWFLV